MTSATPSLYDRLGGYDAISAVAGDFLPRVIGDSQLGRFWAHRGEDGLRREKQLLIDFLCQSSGGPKYYTGRDMRTVHKGMRISESDWAIFMQHLGDTLTAFKLADAERDDVVRFVESTKSEIVEA